MRKTKIILVFIIMALLIGGCATSRGAEPDAWGDATIVAEQRAEIEQLLRDITDMGNYQREVSERIDSITAQLIDGLGRCDTIEDLFRAVDEFVRQLIEENRKLREVWRTDWGAATGEGRRPGGGIRYDRRAGEGTTEEGQYYPENGYSHRAAWDGDFSGYRNYHIAILREIKIILAETLNPLDLENT